MKISKNVVTAMVATAAVFACVGFGFYLGESHGRSINDSLGKYFYSRQSESQQNPTTGSFVTNGEPIGHYDGWLLEQAAILAPDCLPVKAELKTDHLWQENTGYDAIFTLPDEIFVIDSDCTADVYYPGSVKAGETGAIAVIVASDNGYVYCGVCEFTAADDLQIIYGSERPEVAFGGEFDTWAGNRLTLHFYTSATPEHYDNRDGHAGQYGGDGRLSVDFIDTTEHDAI